jgi:hypothetical protein
VTYQHLRGSISRHPLAWTIGSFYALLMTGIALMVIPAAVTHNWGGISQAGLGITIFAGVLSKFIRFVPIGNVKKSSAQHRENHP